MAHPIVCLLELAPIRVRRASTAGKATQCTESGLDGVLRPGPSSSPTTYCSTSVDSNNLMLLLLGGKGQTTTHADGARTAPLQHAAKHRIVKIGLSLRLGCMFRPVQSRVCCTSTSMDPSTFVSFLYASTFISAVMYRFLSNIQRP